MFRFIEPSSGQVQNIVIVNIYYQHMLCLLTD